MDINKDHSYKFGYKETKLWKVPFMLRPLMIMFDTPSEWVYTKVWFAKEAKMAPCTNIL